MCMYDIVVVDPTSNINPKEYCNSISQLFAYVSMGEVSSNAIYRKDISPQWIIGKNKAWNNNAILDQSQPGWQDFFLNQIITPLWNAGFRGFFIDTLDSYLLAVSDKKSVENQIAGQVKIIESIKSRYPDAKIILNRGFHLLPQVHGQIYAVVIESLYNAWNQEKKRYENTLQSEHAYLLTEINKIKQWQLPIIIIDYIPPSKSKDAQMLANNLKKQGLIPWITDRTLQSIYIDKTQTIVRNILIIYAYEKNVPVRFADAFNYLGPIIEYMGYVPTHFELNKTNVLPTGNLKEKYAGIIFWLENQNDKNTFIINWAKKQIDANIPVVFLQNFGVLIENKILSKLGLATSSYESSSTSLKITYIDKTFVGSEISPPITPYDFYPLQITSGQTVLRMQNGNHQTADVIAITPWGGYAIYPYVVNFLPNGRAFWVINPIQFLSKALRLQHFPVPDTTTENGLRLMSVHIDGDGFAYPAKWIGGGFAATELRDRILKVFQIPTSVSVITGEIGPNGIHPKESPQLMEIARSIFALPWVESASHTFSHPLYWQGNKNSNVEGGEPYTMDIPNYKFNLQDEITGSIDFINKNLLSNNKKCKLFFWSGMADPGVDALRLTYQDQLLNINGGSGTNISHLHPSLTNIRPKGIDIDSFYQIFAPIDMDFFYMNYFAGPLYGFENVIQTLELTDKPRRFKPIDLYYHIYSASYKAALDALIKVYQWALAQPVMNIFISDYINKVLDYYYILIAKYNSSWLIQSQGNLRELRSERFLGYPNLTTSQNVIGFKENAQDMYIHLGPSRVTILNYQDMKPNEPYLIDANASVTYFNRSNKQIDIHFHGYLPIKFTLANANQCKIHAKSNLKVNVNKDESITYLSDKDNDEIRINC